MKTVELNAVARENVGKAATKQVRSKSRIPAVVYGRKTKPIPVEIDYREFERVIHTKAGGNVVINLKVSGAKKSDHTVIIKEIQHHPVDDAIRHVDLTVISLTEKIRVYVNVTVKGESIGVKEGGILDVVRHQVEVECLPTQIPEKLEVDISGLNIGDSIHVKDINFPQGVVCLLQAEEVVVAVHTPKEEKEAVPEEGAPAGPEVIAKGKEEAEEGEAAPKAEPKKAETKPEKEQKE